MNAFTEEDADTAMQQAIEELQKAQAKAGQQLASFKSELLSLRSEVDSSMAASQKDTAKAVETLHRELDAKLQTLAADQRQERAEVNARLAAQERGVSEHRRGVERHVAELLEDVSRRQIELGDRLNFHENLIMDEQHGSKNAAVAVTTSERLDSIEQQVQAVKESVSMTAGLREEMSRLQKDSQAQLSKHRREGSLQKSGLCDEDGPIRHLPFTWTSRNEPALSIRTSFQRARPRQGLDSCHQTAALFMSHCHLGWDC